MKTPPLSSLTVSAGCAAILLLFGAACASAPREVGVAEFRPNFVYEPAPVATPIDASATVEASVSYDESIKSRLRSAGNYSETSLAHHAQALTEAYVEDIVKSGAFTQVLPAGDPKAEYRVVIRDEESRFPEWLMRVTLQVTDLQSGQVVSTHVHERSAGLKPYNELLPAIMAELKGQMLPAVQAHVRAKQERAALADAEMFQKMALPELIAGLDNRVGQARARNRAIIAAKNQQLPDMLRQRPTGELSALRVRIEQVILDLNHEGEVAKDRAQQLMANGGAPDQIEGWRGLAISFRERIELLKPILAALEQEIANRNR